MDFSANILGINFSPSLNKGVTNNTGANGSLTLGAIDYLSTTNKSISIGDNSGSAGTLTLTGVTLNGVANTVLANEGSHSLTIEPQIGGGTQDMTLALGNAASNVIQVNGSGGIIISTAIQNGAGVTGSLIKTGPGTLTLSHANTYTGGTTIKKGAFVHEQWVYDGGHYLYLDNGVLRSIQGVGRPESAPAEVTPSEGTPSVTHVVVATATPAPVATPLRNPDTVTITKPISIAVRYGSAGVAAGTKLPFVSRAGDKVRVRYYDGADYDIAIEATDLK
jgi:autotransporter-associated beta strand protein